MKVRRIRPLPPCFAPVVGARLSAFAPHQRVRRAERPQIQQRRTPSVFHRRPRAAPCADREVVGCFDGHRRTIFRASHVEGLYSGKANQQQEEEPDDEPSFTEITLDVKH